jgi:hypothetical protein
MTVIELPDDQAAAVSKKTPQHKAFSVLDEMNALRARVKPDSEGWTTRDFVQHGRR